MRQFELFLACSMFAAVLVVSGRLNQGWISHDDGSLAQSAERILGGELPHRDFAELYSGLLSFLNAAVFAIFGHDIMNLRLPLAVLFVAFAGVYFAVAQRLVRPIWAFAATLFAIAWSVPVYPAPLPSWYGLFLATFAMYAVIRFFDTEAHRWLALAGLCVGISIAVKIVGVYIALALVLGLLVRPLVYEPGLDLRPVRSTAYGRIVIAAGLLAFGFVIVVTSGGLGPNEFVGLLVPIAALCFAVVFLGWKGSWNLAETPSRVLLGEVGVFLGGCAAPLVLLAIPYVVTSSVPDLVEGTIVAPRSRFEFAAFHMPHPRELGWAVPIVVILLARPWMSQRWRNAADAAAGACALYLVLTASSGGSYSALWHTTRALAPFVLVLGAAALIRAASASETRGNIVAVVVLVAGFWTLIQFPFGAPIYFCYVVPLILLAAIAGMRTFGLTAGLLPALVLVCLAVFGMRQLDRQDLASLGRAFAPDPQVVILDRERASIRVRHSEKHELDSVRELVSQHNAVGDPIFAGPDAPEVYFLTQSRNVTPAILDFLDRSGTTRGTKLIALLRSEGIRLIVLNHEPSQSPGLASSTIERIREMYPFGRRVGKFEVRWITQAPATATPLRMRLARG